MENNKILGLIGLASRARNICFGADSVEEYIKNKKIHLVIVASDASERTKEKFKKLCNNYNIQIIIDGKIEELSKAIGKSNKAIIGVRDINIAKGIQKLINGGEFIG